MVAAEVCALLMVHASENFLKNFISIPCLADCILAFHVILKHNLFYKMIKHLDFDIEFKKYYDICRIFSFHIVNDSVYSAYSLIHLCFILYHWKLLLQNCLSLCWLPIICFFTITFSFTCFPEDSTYSSLL